MGNPRAIAIFNRHSGPVDSRTKPTDFVARIMTPLIEGALKDGCKIHMIHDHISHPRGIEDFGVRLEEEMKVPKVMREWKTIERNWRMGAKTALEALDSGRLDTAPGQTILPEIELIGDTNTSRPGSVMNHLNFHDIEAVKEFASYAVLRHLMARNGEDPRLYKELAKRFLDDQSDGMDQLNVSLWLIKMQIDALASCTILRDMELVKQARMIREKHPSDLIVMPRGMTHKSMGSSFCKAGIALEEHSDAWLNDFSDDAIIHLNSSTECADIEVLWSAFLHYGFQKRISEKDFNENSDRRECKIGALDSFIGFLDGSAGGGFRDGPERLGLDATARALIIRSFPYPMQDSDPPRLRDVVKNG